LKFFYLWNNFFFFFFFLKKKKKLIVNKFGFSEAPDKMVILTDDQKDPLMRPTRVNIINAMKWLVSVCFYYYYYYYYY